MKTPKISFITINYNSATYTQVLIQSIEEFTTLPYEIIIVDNNSHADDRDAIASFVKEKEHIRFIANPHNCGFACGNMRGAQEAKGAYLFFINNDTKLLNDTAKILKEYIENKEDIALATASIKDENNNFVSSYKLFPSVIKELFGNTAARKLSNFPSNKVRLKEPTAVEVISGSCMFFKRDTFEAIDGFDEHFFLYCEEEDISKRVWNYGKKVYFIPQAEIYHKGGASASRDYALLQEYYISYTYLIFKHFSKLKASLLYALMVFKLFRRSLRKKEARKLFVTALKGFKEELSLRYKQS